jgi:flavodoxin
MERVILNMDKLVVYFSREGKTRKVAESIAERINADVIEITEQRNRRGVIGFLRSGRESVANKIPEIDPIMEDISKYELVVVASPIWAGSLSTPARAFLIQYGSQIKQAAYCCTMDSNEPEKALALMEELTGKPPVAIAAFRSDNIKDDTYLGKLEEYVEKLQ